MQDFQVIAAVRNNEEFISALKSNVNTVFMLNTNIEEIKEQVTIAHKSGKKLFVHVDLAEGIGKDVYGIKFLKNNGVDGIISTRTNIIKLARKEGVFTVQRFFVVDSKSIETTVESALSSKADMIEIMPGTLSKVIKKLKTRLPMPIVAGGIIETKQEIEEVLKSGAHAVSTGKKILWEL